MAQGHDEKSLPALRVASQYLQKSLCSQVSIFLNSQEGCMDYVLVAGIDSHSCALCCFSRLIHKCKTLVETTSKSNIGMLPPPGRLKQHPSVVSLMMFLICFFKFVFSNMIFQQGACINDIKHDMASQLKRQNDFFQHINMKLNCQEQLQKSTWRKDLPIWLTMAESIFHEWASDPQENVPSD